MLIMEMSLVSFDERLGFATMTGKAYVGGRVCFLYFKFMLLLLTLIVTDLCSSGVLFFCPRKIE